jgi:hypothetical protein
MLAALIAILGGLAKELTQDGADAIDSSSVSDSARGGVDVGRDGSDAGIGE